MDFTSLSATSLQVWQSCPARWKAQYAKGRPGELSGLAADLGSGVHAVLERYVDLRYLKRTTMTDTEAMGFLFGEWEQQKDALGITDPTMVRDGWEMIERWYARTTPVLGEGHRTVLSVEQKTEFPIKTPKGERPFRYIWDRCDRIDKYDPETGEITGFDVEVTDYKTIRARLNPGDLKEKIQARAYGVAAQIAYPEAERVWITFDLLRHDPVGIVFSRDENLAAWRWIKEKAKEIAGTHPDDAPERINSECKWCIRKAACKALRSNADAGGIVGLSDPVEAARMRATLDNQLGGLKTLIADLDKVILEDAEANGWEELEADDLTITTRGRRTRVVEPSVAASVLGPELFARWGTMTVTALDKLLKTDDLTPDERERLNAAIGYKVSDPSVRVVPRGPIGE